MQRNLGHLVRSPKEAITTHASPLRSALDAKDAHSVTRNETRRERVGVRHRRALPPPLPCPRRSPPQQGLARAQWPKATWWVQLALNFLWTPVFFEAHQIGLALAIIVALLAAILVFIASSTRVDTVAAWLFAPYGAWVGFAAVLNASIWMLN